MRFIIGLTVLCGVFSLVACGQQRTIAADTSEPEAPATTATAWPAALNPFGDGYPKAGDVCRRVGESAATANFLDDSAVLVGCPVTETATIAALGGRQVGSVESIALISIPQDDANAGMSATQSSPATEQGTPVQ
jgi:hypothetical protein